jgi:hypothetical protein
MARKGYLKAVYDHGTLARQNGWERNSPYQKMVAENYWYAGYDLIDFYEFDKFVRESRRSSKTSLGYSRIGLNNI